MPASPKLCEKGLSESRVSGRLFCTPLPLSEAFGVKPSDGGLSDEAISLPDGAEREGRLWSVMRKRPHHLPRK